MTHTPSPAHTGYRTTKRQADYFIDKFDEHHPTRLAAESADLIVEALACKDCQRVVPDMVASIIAADQTVASSIILSLAASVVQADKTIRQGMTAYESLDDETKAGVSFGE